MEFIKELIILENKARSGNYELYHKSYSNAISTALNLARKKGYDLDEDEVFSKIGSGPRKPQPGDTNRITLSLTQDGHPVREKLHIQVFNKGESHLPYELNTYIW